MQSFRSNFYTFSGELGPTWKRYFEFPHFPFVEDVGTAQQIIPINFLEVETDITEKQFPIFEILQRNLIGKQLIKRSIEDVLDEIFDWTEIGKAWHDLSEYIAKNHWARVIIITYS